MLILFTLRDSEILVVLYRAKKVITRLRSVFRT